MNKSQKLRMTRQRQVILEELRNSHSHPTADQVYQMVRRRLPCISLGTVYRNLEILSNEGIIMKLELGGTQRRYDGQTKNHYHKRCINCGKVEDIDIEPIEAIEKFADNDFKIIGYRLEFLGICPKCRKKNGKNLKIHKKEVSND